MNLERLRVFLQIVDSGSMSAAARAVREQLGPAEPGVRDALQRLAAACSAAAASP